MLHGKRIELKGNLNVFPKDYYGGKDIYSLKLVGEVRKGIWNGAGSIHINGKKVCQT